MSARHAPGAAPVRLLVFAPAHADVQLLRGALTLAAGWRAETQGAVELWQAHGADPAALDLVVHEYDVVLRTQAEGDPGTRLWLALAANLARGAVPLLIDAASPGLALRHLRAAQAALAGCDAVCLTAADGSLALLGLARAVPEVLAGIPWGQAPVLPALRARAQRWKFSLKELAQS